MIRHTPRPVASTDTGVDFPGDNTIALYAGGTKVFEADGSKAALSAYKPTGSDALDAVIDTLIGLKLAT